MEGGSLHWLWAPYKLYGSVDLVYGWKAYNGHNGFTAAQAFLNILETLAYLYYAYVFAGAASARAANMTVGGRRGALGLLVGFSAALMTLSKTVLYCEYPSLVLRHHLKKGDRFFFLPGETDRGDMVVLQSRTNTFLVSTTLATIRLPGSSSCGSSPSKPPARVAAAPIDIASNADASYLFQRPVDGHLGIHDVAVGWRHSQWSCRRHLPAKVRVTRLCNLCGTKRAM